MRFIRDLTDVELRILGALLEKEQATPGAYPLTVNALLAAANQKTNREPVTRLTETQVVEALEALRQDVLAWRTEGARAERWSQSISRRLELDPEEKAVLTLLMLRGPQTPGELRTRSGRLQAFDSVAEVRAALARMAADGRDLVAELPRQAGQKERRWRQLLGDDPGEPGGGGAAPEAPETALPDPDLEARVRRLEERLAELEHRLG